jgi:hypothetical protein
VRTANSGVCGMGWSIVDIPTMAKAASAKWVRVLWLYQQWLNTNPECFNKIDGLCIDKIGVCIGNSNIHKTIICFIGK